MGNPAETAYLSVRDGKLSNAVWLVEFRPRKVAVYTFFGLVPSRAAQTAFASELSKAITFFVLGPILVKFHIRTWLIESFPTIFRTWWCAEEELHLTPFHTLRQPKQDEVLFCTTSEGRRVSSEVPSDERSPVLGGTQNLEAIRPTIQELLAF